MTELFIITIVLSIAVWTILGGPFALKRWVISKRRCGRCTHHRPEGTECQEGCPEGIARGRHEWFQPSPSFAIDDLSRILMKGLVERECRWCDHAEVTQWSALLRVIGEWGVAICSHGTRFGSHCEQCVVDEIGVVPIFSRHRIAGL